ncbi:murein biosynthesis integral membrane protein MurJ [Lachnospiraceae bacterium NSJ-143]|nr:murein biosynthesis integral membrane protein MurJ [Lachnospiraceae bacterium NSJ-143]
MESKSNSAVKAAGLMMAITLIGKVLGLVREMFLASSFSISEEANAFVAASQIPRVFFDIVFASAISASFIPVFNEYMKKRGKKEAFLLSSNFITLVGILSMAITVLGIVFAPYLSVLFADGFDQQTIDLCTRLLRILFPTTIFTGIAFSFVGVLQSMDEFNIPAAMSIVSNLIIIIYFIFFNDRFGVYGLTVAFLIGWAMQAVIQIPSLLKKGYKYRFYLNIKDSGIKKIIILMLPVMVGTWVQPVNLAVNTKFASKLFEGSGVSAVNYANTVYSIIIGVFVLSIANVIFPRLSRMSVDKDHENFSRTISSTLEAMAFLIIPMTLGLMVLSEPVIRLIYQRGNFSNFAVDITAKALFYFSIGMPGFGIHNILSRAFYARQNGRIPLISGLVSIAVNIVLCNLLIGKLDIGGLALASAVSQTVAAAILFIPMQKENRIVDKFLINEVIKMVLASVIMALSAVLARNAALSYLSGGFVSNVIVTAVSAMAGIVVYALVSYILKVNAMKLSLDIIFKTLKRSDNP